MLARQFRVAASRSVLPNTASAQLNHHSPRATSSSLLSSCALYFRQHQQSQITACSNLRQISSFSCPFLSSAILLMNTPATQQSDDLPPTIKCQASRRKRQKIEPEEAQNETIAPPSSLVLERRRSSRSRKEVKSYAEKEEVDMEDVDPPVAASSSSSGMPSARHADLPDVVSSSEVECATQDLLISDSLEMDVVEEQKLDDDTTLVKETKVSIVRKSSTVRKRKQKVELTYDERRYTPQALASQFWVGCHVSAAGGVSHAIENASLIGARAVALDLKSKRSWNSQPLSPEEAARFKAKMTEFKMTPNQFLPHGSYLMNLGSPNEEVYAKSKANLLDELQRCKLMGLTQWNFHPGSTCGLITREACIAQIAKSLNEAHELTKDESYPNGGVITVIENMAGQGNAIGGKLEDLKEIIDLITDKRRVGVCIDTCHAFAVGYDLRTSADVASLLTQFNTIVGAQYLKGVHLNDSKSDLNSKRDRHESIGCGKIGHAGFRAIMNSSQFHRIPMILETPCEDMKVWQEKYASEIAGLYQMEENAVEDNRNEEFKLKYEQPTEEERKEMEAAKKEKSLQLKRKRQEKKRQENEEDVDEEEEDGEEEEKEDEEQESKSKAPRSLKRQSSAEKSKGKR